MSSLTWPATVPIHPLLGTLSISRQTAVASFEPDYGAPIRRLRSTSANKRVSFAVMMSVAQYELFREWFRKTLRHGVLSFNRPDPEDVCNQVIREFTFIEPFTPEFVAPDAVRVSVSLMCQETMA